MNHKNVIDYYLLIMYKSIGTHSFLYDKHEEMET